MDRQTTTSSHKNYGWLKLTRIHRVRQCACVVVVTLVCCFMSIILFTNHAYITTPSMYPTIPPGSMVFLHAEPSYHVGEVIEFRANGLLWIHRLVGIRTDGSFITKGDNPQSTPDVFVPEVRASDVVGAVSTSVPYAGFPELIVHSPRYALQWLQAELGLRGRIALLGVAVGLAALLVSRRRYSPRSATESEDIALEDKVDEPVIVVDESITA